MNRKRFLKSGAAFLGITPLTPLIPNVGAPTNMLPLPFATSTPAPVPGTTLLNPAVSTIPYYLAAVGPETGSLVPLQQQIQNGIRGAIDDANSERGTLDRLVDVHLYDDLGNSNMARVAASSAVSDIGVMATIGHLGTACTLAALETYAQAQMPLLVPISTADEITRHGYTNIFRLATRDSLEGRYFAQHLIDKFAPGTVGIVCPSDGYGVNVATAFAGAMRGKNRVVVECMIPPIADAAQVEKTLAPLIKAKPDLIFFAGTTEMLATGVRLVRARVPGARLTASQGFFELGTITALGPVAEGLMVSSSMPQFGKNAAASMKIQVYGETYGQLTPMAAFAYAAAQIAIAAVRRTEAVSRSPVVQNISRGGTYTTIVGDFRFDAFGDPADPNLYYYVVKNGTWAAAGSKRPVLL